MIALAAPESAPRIICDRNDVASGVGIGCSSHAREDVWLQGDADDVAADLAVATGWIEDLAAFEDVLPEASRATLDRVR